MKKIYTLTLASVCLLISYSSNAQTYTGGTYTVVKAGNWHDSGPNVIWEPSEPSPSCSNCLIIVDVPGTVVLNTAVTLSNNSSLVIGGSNTVVLEVPNSGATGFAGAHNIVLLETGASSTIQLANSNASISVDNNVGNQGDFDGIFTTAVSGPMTNYYKQVGYAPEGFTNGTVSNAGTVPYTSLPGPATLSTSGTLPVVLTAFDAVVDNEDVDLTWTTAQELNSSYFEVQSSNSAGAAWNNIGRVAAHGNSALPIDYTYTDTKPGTGTIQYRLQMVDLDGRTSYSQVKVVRVGQVIASVSIYPNPAANYVNIVLGGTVTGNVSIRLISTSGQVLMEKTVSGAAGTTASLAVSSFPQGNYLLLLVGSDGSQQVEKLLISK